MSSELSRRDFLKLAVHGIEAALVTACAPTLVKTATETLVPNGTGSPATKKDATQHPEVPALTQQDIEAWQKTVGDKFTVSGNGIEGMKDVILGPDTAALTYHDKTYVFPRSDAKIGKDGNLWVAGYEWNDSSWEVILPGAEFPALEDMPIFSKEDIKNGNWLAWYEVVFDQINAKDQFADVDTSVDWTLAQGTVPIGPDMNGDNMPEVLDGRSIAALDLSIREKMPYKFSNVFVYIPDADIVLGSNDLKNADDTFAHFGTALDPVLFGEDKRVEQDVAHLSYMSGYTPKVSIDDPHYKTKIIEIVSSYGPKATIDSLGGVSMLELLRTGSPMAVENERIVQETIRGNGNFDPKKVGRQIWGLMVIYYHQ